MNNKLEILRAFCSLAETLQFKETAHRLALSPSVITRMIADLEDYLGEPLFVRNTRQVHLTPFAKQFLPKALQLLEDSEQLFGSSKHYRQDEISGVVRLTMPNFPLEMGVTFALLQALADYPQLILDFSKSPKRLNLVEEQIDLGVRLGELADSRLVARKVGKVKEILVASPDFVERYGKPQDLDDLQRNFPLCAIFDENRGKLWHWHFAEDQHFSLKNPAVIAGDFASALEACLAGRGVAYLSEFHCQPYLQSGKLQELLPEVPKRVRSVYVYRPQQNVLPKRTRLVFDLLVQILTEKLGDIP